VLSRTYATSEDSRTLFSYPAGNAALLAAVALLVRRRVLKLVWVTYRMASTRPPTSRYFQVRGSSLADEVVREPNQSRSAYTQIPIPQAGAETAQTLTFPEVHRPIRKKVVFCRGHIGMMTATRA